MTLEDAILSVDMFLDGAVLNRLKLVSIIHGKGTGVLRAGIQKHLKSIPPWRNSAWAVMGKAKMA